MAYVDFDSLLPYLPDVPVPRLEHQFLNYGDKYGEIWLRYLLWGANLDVLPEECSAVALNQYFHTAYEGDGDVPDTFPYVSSTAVQYWIDGVVPVQDTPEKVEAYTNFINGMKCRVIWAMWVQKVWSELEDFYQVGTGGKGGSPTR